MNFPASAPVKALNQQHPEYAFYQESWAQTDLLYRGGVAIREAVIRNGMFLMKNTKELPEVFTTRQLRFSYTNLLGAIVGWYMSALFKAPPQLEKKLAGSDPTKTTPAKPITPVKLPKDAQDFCERFEKDCDHAGTTLNDFFRKAAETMLLYRCAYVALDLPAPGEDLPQTLEQQKRAGLLNPFLVQYSPRDVINWKLDTYGNLEWLCVKIRIEEQDFLQPAVVKDCWYFFDRQEAALYERTVQSGPSASVTTENTAEEMATLAPGYPRRHAMADQNRVPISRIDLPEGLWLANRVFLLLVNHLNLDNAHDFGLYQANLPQLVIEDGLNGAYEEPVTISAVGYHKIPNGGSMSYLEPEGRAFETTQKRLEALEERIYKTCYLMDQARTNRSTPTAQSGASKQADKTPSRDALSGIGDVMRPGQQSIYRDALAIAGFPTIEPDVRGFDFSDRATAEDMSLLEQATVIPVNSPTFEREVGKKNVVFTLPDLNPETKQKIIDEIDANPTPAEQQAQLEEQQRESDLAKFGSSLKSASAGESQSE